MNVFSLAEKEDVDVEVVFRFAHAHFGWPTSTDPDLDYQDFRQGGRLPKYVEEMLAYKNCKRLN